MSVRSKLVAFLNQRRTAAKRRLIPNSDFVIRETENLLNELDMLRNYDDRRHLLELHLKRHRFEKLLPEAKGGHDAIRNHMLELMEVAGRTAAMIYEQRNSLNTHR